MEVNTFFSFFGVDLLLSKKYSRKLKTGRELNPRLQKRTAIALQTAFPQEGE